MSKRNLAYAAVGGTFLVATSITSPSVASNSAPKSTLVVQPTAEQVAQRILKDVIPRGTKIDQVTCKGPSLVADMKSYWVIITEDSFAAGRTYPRTIDVHLEDQRALAGKLNKFQKAKIEHAISEIVRIFRINAPGPGLQDGNCHINPLRTAKP